MFRACHLVPSNIASPNGGVPHLQHPPGTHSSTAPRDDAGDEDGGVSPQREPKAVLSSPQVDSPHRVPLVFGRENREGPLGSKQKQGKHLSVQEQRPGDMQPLPSRRQGKKAWLLLFFGVEVLSLPSLLIFLHIKTTRFMHYKVRTARSACQRVAL